MSFFKTRSDYFKSIASQHKLIAHGKFVSGDSGPLRSSFYRINDEQELLSACQNWAHFPCLVLVGMAGRYGEKRNDVPKRRVSTQIILLSKAQNISSMDDIESSYDIAFGVLEDIVSRIRSDWNRNAYCAGLINPDLSAFSFDMAGPIYSGIYGWSLVLNEEFMAEDLLKNDPSKWFDL